MPVLGPILAAVSILNTYVAHDLNGLGTYNPFTVHEQDTIVARHKRTNLIHAIAQHVT